MRLVRFGSCSFKRKSDAMAGIPGCDPAASRCGSGPNTLAENGTGSTLDVEGKSVSGQAGQPQQHWVRRRVRIEHESDPATEDANGVVLCRDRMPRGRNDQATVGLFGPFAAGRLRIFADFTAAASRLTCGRPTAGRPALRESGVPSSPRGMVTHQRRAPENQQRDQCVVSREQRVVSRRAMKRG